MKVSAALDTIRTLDELAGFAETLRDPPEGVTVEKPTAAEWERIAVMKADLQRRDAQSARLSGGKARTGARAGR